MEYFRNENYKIYADMAYRIGRLVEQYKSSKQDEKFEVTFSLISLQSLLTIFDENRISMSNRKMKIHKDFFRTEITDLPKIFGVSKSCIKQDSFYEKVSLQTFLKHLRNAMSHPVNSISDNPLTGFCSISEQGNIKKISFIDSPDIRSKQGDLRPLPKVTAQKSLDEILQLTNFKDLTIRKHPNAQGKYLIYKGTEPFYKVFEIVLSPDEIDSLVIELSNFLAQPIQENWDGKTIHRLVG